MHSTCTVHAQYMYSTCTVHVQYMFIIMCAYCIVIVIVIYTCRNCPSDTPSL